MALILFCAVLGTAFVFELHEHRPGVRRDIVDRINEVRASPRNCGGQVFEAVPPVQWNRTLAQAAFRHSSDLMDLGEGRHIGTDGSTPETRIAELGYEARGVAEIVAVGSDYLGDVMRGWLVSPSHCAVIMSDSFDEAGAAVAGAQFWTVNFGIPVR